jgi:hypothetical protein
MLIDPEKTPIERSRLVLLLDKWSDDAAWLERLNGRLEPYNAYTADAIRACRAELKEIMDEVTESLEI